MGLDSVELVMEFEGFFQVTIPDAEAEKMVTVKMAIDYIDSVIVYKQKRGDIKSRMHERLNEVLLNLHLIEHPVSPDQNIFDVLPLSNEIAWKEVSEQIIYELPFPVLKNKFNKFLHWLFSSKINYEETTIDRFVDLICGVNYKRVLRKGQLQNRYEVFIAIMGITVGKLGVSAFEVFEDKSFVSDFGAD